MENTISTLISQEKRKKVILAVVIAVISAGLILGLSFGLNFLNNSNPSTNNQPTSPDGNTNLGTYVAQLNNYLDSEYNADNIAYFMITGNITNTINPRLISSELSPDFANNRWQVDAFVLPPDLNVSNAYEDTFYFPTQEVTTMHNSFLSSLVNTKETVEPQWPPNAGTIPQLLIYQAYFTNSSALEFVWIGFQDITIIQVSHGTWELSSGHPSFNYNSEDVHYLTPLSAFDSFITTLQGIYTTILG